MGKVAEADDDASAGEAHVGEALGVVDDAPDGEHEAGDDAPIIYGPGSRAERDSTRRLPHGGRQMSWWVARHIHRRWRRSVGQGNDGARAGLGNKHANTRDVPRFRALLWR